MNFKYLISMKTGTGIILAGTVGIIIGLGIYGFRRMMRKKGREYDDYYSDFHRHFDKRYRDEAHHGVEYLSAL